MGALSFLKADEVFENRSLIVGNPAKKIKEVTDDMMRWKKSGTSLYQQLPKDIHESWKVCEPLRTIPENIRQQLSNYKTWNESK